MIPNYCQPYDYIKQNNWLQVFCTICLQTKCKISWHFYCLHFCRNMQLVVNEFFCFLLIFLWDVNEPYGLNLNWFWSVVNSTCFVYLNKNHFGSNETEIYSERASLVKRFHSKISFISTYSIERIQLFD